jgi:hypothetical protein
LYSKRQRWQLIFVWKRPFLIAQSAQTKFLGCGRRPAVPAYYLMLNLCKRAETKQLSLTPQFIPAKKVAWPEAGHSPQFRRPAQSKGKKVGFSDN